MRSRLILPALTALVTSLSAQEPGSQAPHSAGAEPKIAPQAVATIRLTPAGDTINPGDCRKFTAVAYDAARRPLAVSGFTFSISDATRLKVDPPSGEVCASAQPSRKPTAVYVNASLPSTPVTGNASVTIRARRVLPVTKKP